MDGEEDFADGDYYGDLALGVPEVYQEPLRCLLERKVAIRNLSSQESTNYTNSSERQRQKTLESILKLFGDSISEETWLNFQHAAANLHRMHTLVKNRMNRVFKTSYEQGFIDFSANFLKDFRKSSQNRRNNRPLPVDILAPLLSSSSDPPLGTFRRRQRILRVRPALRPRFQASRRSSTGSFNVSMLPTSSPSLDRMSNEIEPNVLPTGVLSPAFSDEYCNCSSCSSSSSSSASSDADCG
ncbi:hypothetical protein Aperf_G00000067932 [Anoplocephala perfoliata]